MRRADRLVLGCLAPGLGTLRALPDPLLADLFGSLQAGELLACAAVSQAFYPGLPRRPGGGGADTQASSPDGGRK